MMKNMTIRAFSLVISLFLFCTTAVAECRITHDDLLSGINVKEGTLCAFGEGYDQQPEVYGEARSNPNSNSPSYHRYANPESYFSPQEQFQIIRSLYRQRNDSTKSLLDRAVRGATTPLRKPRFYTIQVFGNRSRG